MKILVATKNRGKFNEISGFLNGLKDVDVEFLGDLDVRDDDFVEDGETHEENAMKKARYYWNKVCGRSVYDFVLGEDSGIYVDALADELGVHTRRWGAGHDASDKEWLEYFMKEMALRAIEDERRGAKFVCHACLKGADHESFYSGETLGKITRDISCAVLPGLPLSSVFRPEGFDQVYAELGRDKKNEISHRGQAISKVKEFLTKLKWNS